MRINEFWELTPAELNLIINCYQKDKQDDFKKDITIAYYNAYFQRVKTMPKLKDFLIKLDRRPMTDEEMFRQVVGLNKRFGGDG